MHKPGILFMGTPAFALPALESLIRNDYPIIGVVTQPDRPRGRGQTTSPSPIKLFAKEHGLNILQPEKVRDPSFLAIIRDLNPKIAIVAAFGQILPGEIIHGTKEGCINIHPSLLPKYRGAAPINRAIMEGEQTTGVTIMRMDEGVDSGAILLQEETPIGTEETFGELHDRLAIKGAELLLIALERMLTGTLQPHPQDHRLATTAPRLGRDDCHIHWQSDCRKIVAQIRGLSPFPSAYTCFEGKPLKVFTAEAETASVAETPGTVVGETLIGLRVAAGGGYVLLKEVQLAGRKRMPAHDFLLGCKMTPGQILG
jgi:methionyl-tRNA formyltransferase